MTFLVGPPGRRTAALAAAALLALVGGGCGSGSHSSPTPTPTPAATPTVPVKVAGSVVATAGSSNEMSVVVPDELKASWTSLGGRGRGVEFVQVAGDGSTRTAAADLTGDSAARIVTLTDQINALHATSPGRSALSGLDHVASPAGAPVWVFSPLLDTERPLDFNELAFDESPQTVVKAVTKAGRLPKLKGREVTYVVTPVAGQQKKLSALQVGYQHAVWEGIARAGGAKKVTFFVGTGTAPGSGTIIAVPIPNPNDKITAEHRGAKTTTCTLPSPALFVSDQATLIDKSATLKALKSCVGTINPTTKITVEGHTAGVAGADNSFTRSLSVRRATEVAALIRELKVPAQNITKVTGYGSSKPLLQPSSNPKNRAVVVTFTTGG